MVEYEYNAWGKHKVVNADGAEITESTHIGNKNVLRYRGYIYDTATGLYYLNARFYDHETGRFISMDDISYADVSTYSGLNLYAYCRNNPIMYFDPTGHIGIGTLILLSIFVATILASDMPHGEPKQTAPITERLNLYDDKTGARQKGKINVKFSPSGDNPSFQIENSYEITDEQEQREILEYIMASDYYSQDVYGRTIDSMLIEWQSHNDFSFTRLKRVLHTDFDRDSEGMTKMDYWKLAIGEGWKILKGWL